MLFARGWRIATATTAALLSSTALAQTYSSCNPLSSTSCPADTALGMTIDIDFTQGAVNSFVASGSPTYGKDGASFTVAKSGDAPQLNSVFYIMFGRVEVTMKAAPGAGIVSSLVLLSDDLDEIDMEWLGADSTEVQTNYFSKGQTTTYNRGQFNPAANNQADFITYTIDWTSDRIIWYVGGTVVRTLTYSDANGQYPQTPMQVKFGAWSGGDPANPEGTIQWARGPTDYSKGPFSMVVRSAVITDYSTGKKYTYGDTSGSWQSIKSDTGKINGNVGNAGALTVTASAPAATNSLSPTIPAGGILGSTSTGSSSAAAQTVGTIPDGWVMTSSGKIVPVASSTTPPAQSTSLAPSSSLSPSSPQGPGGDTSSSITSTFTTFTASATPAATAGTSRPGSSSGGGVPTAAPAANDAASARRGGVASGVPAILVCWLVAVIF